MKLTHFEKQAKRRELKSKGFNPQEVEKQLKILTNSKIMEDEQKEEAVEVDETPEVLEEEAPAVEVEEEAPAVEVEEEAPAVEVAPE